MGRKIALLAVSVTVMFFISLKSQNASSKKTGFFAAGNWQFEIQGGWSAINPRCLNSIPQYYKDTVYFQVLRSYIYKRQIYGSLYNYTFSFDSNNDFRKLKNVFPLGITIRYQVSRRLGVSLGLSYMSGQAKSFYHVSIDTKTIPPDSYGTWGNDDIDVRDLTYDDTSISMKSWIPTAGIHFDILSRSIFHSELFATAGPVFGSFKHRYHKFDKYTFPDGFWFGSEYRDSYKGRGVGIALSCGGRLGFELTSRFEIFAMAGYELISVPKLSGSAEKNRRYLDVESEPPQFTRNESEGTWYLESVWLFRTWGRQRVDLPNVTTHPSQPENKFHLNLSGFLLQAGIAFRL